MPSGKADRNNLPEPTHRHTTSTVDYIAPRTETEHSLVSALAAVLDLPTEEVSVTADLFADLGANSLHLARFRARLRDDSRMPPVSMRQVYEHPTVADLATAMPEVDDLDAEEQPAVDEQPEPAREGVSTLQYLLCGLGQFAALAGYLFLLTWAFTPGFNWIGAANGLAATYGRSAAVGTGLFATLCAAPVALKWVLIGRWTPGEIPLWGWRYLRFWFVKTLLRVNPMVLFLGTPLYNLYLRALGAKVGRDALVLSRSLPICTDLISIGSHAVVRKDVFFNAYRAQGTRIETGTVTIGAHALVGEGSVLDINTEIGDHTQLAHASALHSGRALPARTHWHGSPAERTTVDYLNIERGQAPSTARKITHCLTQLLPLLVLYLPVSLGLLDETVLEGRWKLPIGTPAQPSFYLDTALIATVLFVAALLVGFAVVTVLPRLLKAVTRPGRVYPLYGTHYGLQRLVFRITNAKLFMRLFGDSPFIVPYLRALGYRLAPVRQTGSNFGVQQQHEVPFLTRVGTGTMVSDGISAVNAWHSSTSFRMDEAALGANTFVGNSVRYPSGARTGDNCLLATKVLVPLDGEVQENTGLLGSPPMRIPRSVHRDEEMDHPRTEQQFRRALRAKTRYNLATLLLYLAALCLYCVGAVMVCLLTDSFPQIPSVTDTGAELAELVLTLGYFAVLERATLGFRRLRPRSCSIYERSFWRHERFWKFATPMFPIIDGTPLKPVLLRLLGVRVGRQVFDDGCTIPEKTLVSIGDRCALNMGTVVQGHSLEDGGFKSDHVLVEPDSTLRTGAFVHYGTTVSEGSTVDADAFLMKGEKTGRGRHWRGNPAQEVTTAPRRQPALARSA
jgi:non-ribosomal peptide synthetase-like protein